ncbi:MAG TPA: hypothetical protein VK760_00780 [Candidatus Acidoferrales bacterium]|jgi:hypothetical protein|nr:hypothetical protein [Candidatus Acidoferrales bacterium]
MNIARFGAAALAAAVFVAAAGSARAVVPASHTLMPAMAQPAFSLTDNNAADMQYCRSTGGIVEHRIPEYGTNNPNPLVLAGSADFCQYTSKDKSSRIHVLLTTLNATLPSLAAMAYYAHPKLIEGPCTSGGANPASCYCTQLGGSDQFGGANLAGGAWVGRGIDADLEACIFPDMSSIDSWGLAYRSNGTIRGTDLSKVLKYKKPK